MANVTNGMKAYGDALFMLTEELGETEAVLSDLETVEAVVNQNPTYLGMLDSPALSRDERLSLIDRAFSTLNKNLVNTVKILAEKRLSQCCWSGCSWPARRLCLPSLLHRPESGSAV